MLTDERCQRTMVDFLNGKDVSTVKIALPPLKFLPIPPEKKLDDSRASFFRRYFVIE